jgi:antitoxin component of MazEF toxin-antitoxin module
MPGKGRGKIRAATEEIRTVFKLGPSLVMAVPSRYLRTHNLKAGDLVRVFYSDQVNALYIEPITGNETVERLEKIRSEIARLGSPRARLKMIDSLREDPTGGKPQAEERFAEAVPHG